jgi:hypothetical protein
LILSAQILGEDFRKAIELLSAKVAKGSNPELVNTIHEKLMIYEDEYIQDIGEYLPPAAKKIVPERDQYLDTTVGSGDLSSVTTWTTTTKPQVEQPSITVDWGAILRQQDGSKDSESE